MSPPTREPDQAKESLLSLAGRGGFASVADAIRARDAAALAAVAAAPIKPLANNLVERPWGGLKIREYKGLHPLPYQKRITGLGLGEAFEISAFRADTEAREHPSIIPFRDGSRIDLPGLLDAAGAAVLGGDFLAAFGPEIPLLPKTLDIKELLSAQAHPEGHTEAYIILEADRGATIRLGFRENVDPEGLREDLTTGRRLQQAFLDFLKEDANQRVVNDRIAANFARRSRSAEDLAADLEPQLRAGGRAEAEGLLRHLKAVYWKVLDLLNEIPVHQGQVIHNATPERIARRSGRRPSAEVHALGNPEGLEILALEIRRPGVTHRAWDNVRFPIRAIAVEEALAALNLEATAPADFNATPRPAPGRRGVARSVSCPSFVIDHLRPAPGRPVLQETDGACHTLHAVKGSVRIRRPGGGPLETLARGESALVPAGLDAYQITTGVEETEVIRVSIPLAASPPG